MLFQKMPENARISKEEPEKTYKMPENTCLVFSSMLWIFSGPTFENLTFFWHFLKAPSSRTPFGSLRLPLERADDGMHVGVEGDELAAHVLLQAQAFCVCVLL